MLFKSKKKYGVIEGSRDQKPWIGNVDLSLLKFNSKKNFPWFVSIKIYLPMTDIHGLPSHNESLILNDFEDNLLKLMKEQSEVFYLGRISWNGIRELFLQASDAKKINNFFQDYISKEKYSREFEYEIKHDPEWKNALSVLKPKRHIKNLFK